MMEEQQNETCECPVCKGDCSRCMAGGCGMCPYCRAGRNPLCPKCAAVLEGYSLNEMKEKATSMLTVQNVLILIAILFVLYFGYRYYFKTT